MTPPRTHEIDDSGHGPSAAQAGSAAVIEPPASHLTRDSHGTTAGGGRHTQASRYIFDGAVDRVKIAATGLDELELPRIAMENRERTLRMACEWCRYSHSAKEMAAMPSGSFLCAKCGQTTSKFDALYPDGALSLATRLIELEKIAGKQLDRAVREHPLGPAIDNMVGVGVRQAGRLLAVIGDPSWNDLHGRPRTVSELWAYCGFHVLPAGQGASDAHSTNAGGQPSCRPGDQPALDALSTPVPGVAPSRSKGQRANWNNDARMRAVLVAMSCIKQKHRPDAVYGQLYDLARAREEGRVHDAPCAQCGLCDTCGKPPGISGPQHREDTGCTARKVRHAQPGDPLRDGHKHARARRKVAKAVLRDLWVAANDWHATHA